MNDDKDAQDLVVSENGKMSTNDEVVKENQDTSAEPVNDISAPPHDDSVIDSDPGTPEDNNVEASEGAQGEPITVRTEPEDAITPDEETQKFHESNEEPEPVVNSQFTAAPEPSLETQTSTSESTTQEKTIAEHPNNRKFIAFIVITVALLLAGAAVFLYMSAEDNTVLAPTTNPIEVDELGTEPATINDVDESLQAVDETLQSLDDEADFNNQELDDEALGL